MTKQNKEKKIMDNMFALPDTQLTIGIGKSSDFKDYEEVTISKEKFMYIVKYVETNDFPKTDNGIEKIKIRIKKDKPLIIEKGDVGIFIAPIVED